jgi:hypothetical protein
MFRESILHSNVLRYIFFLFDNTGAGGMVLLQTEDIKHFYIPFCFKLLWVSLL